MQQSPPLKAISEHEGCRGTTSFDMEEGACSMQTALEHQPVEVGSSSGGEFSLRENAMGEIVRAYAYTPLGASAMEREAQAYTYHEIGAGPFHVPAGSYWVLGPKCVFFSYERAKLRGQS